MSTQALAEVVIQNRRGLHARATAKFVKTAASYNAKVYVCRIEECDEEMSGTSILGLMALAAEPGATIRIRAEGSQAQEAVEALVALVNDKFGEGE